MAQAQAAFSLGQVGWFVLFLVVSVGVLTLVWSGAFAGRRARWGGLLLGLVLVADLSRANLPWVLYWNYPEKYETYGPNPIIQTLRDKPYEHRVAYGLPWPLSTPPEFASFGTQGLYGIEWTQHLFPYYNIQTLDKIQMPRTPEDLRAYETTLRIGIKQDSSGQWHIEPETFPRVARLWELTNTRYLLGPANLVSLLNEQFDPDRHRFRLVQRFGLALKPDIERFTQSPDEITAVPSANGEYALLEFTGALPRAKLYSNWQVITNENATLQMLTNADFDPQQTVLVSTPLPVSPNATNQNSGTVEFKSYAPKDIVFSATNETPSVLLLNDKFDPQWRVFVDGQPATLLHCNFIMRGVYLTPGSHTVEFIFRAPMKMFYVSLAATILGVLLIGYLIFGNSSEEASVSEAAKKKPA
jgi:hypothetical protein